LLEGYVSFGEGRIDEEVWIACGWRIGVGDWACGRASPA
jgi:hypothetical protein